MWKSIRTSDNRNGKKKFWKRFFVNPHALGIPAARLYGLKIDFLRNPISESAAWFFDKKFWPQNNFSFKANFDKLTYTGDNSGHTDSVDNILPDSVRVKKNLFLSFAGNLWPVEYYL